MSTPYRSKSTIHKNRQSVNSDHLPCALHHSATLCNTRQHSTTAVRAFKPPKHRELMPQYVTPELAAALLAAYLCTLANLQTAHDTPRYLFSTIHKDPLTHIPYVYMNIYLYICIYIHRYIHTYIYIHNYIPHMIHTHTYISI